MLPIRNALILALLPLAGCSVGPDYRPAAPSELGVPDTYSVSTPAAPASTDLTRWWDGFGDPQLTALVEQAQVSNLDLAQAVARLRQARESLVQSRATLFPQVGASGGYSRSFGITGGSTNTITLPDGTITTISTGSGRTNFSVGGDINYQLGLFGEVRRTVEASRAQLDAARYDYAAVLLSTQAEVARNYLLARLNQAQLANARASLGIQDDNLEIAGFRVQAGLVSSLDQEQARASRAQTAATIPNLEQNFAAAVARLGVLTGQAPGALRGQMAASRPIPAGAVQVASGIPADTLRQRPDIRSAERTLAAATAQIGVAEAALYPALAISGNINGNSDTLGSVFDMLTGRLFAGLTQTIFDGGRLRSQVRSARAAADGAFGAYRSTVLTALEEVENAMVALNSARVRAAEFRTALDAASAAAILSRSQYRAGLTDFTTLNQQEAALVSARNGLAQAQADQATALVQLYLALGGGWDESSIPSAAPISSPLTAGQPR